MADLAQLALARIQGSLPSFPGASLPEQLQNGRTQAHAILLKYVPALRFDLDAARDVMSEVNAWAERNQEQLSDAMRSPETDLPRWMQLNMGSAERVQQWVIANFTVAAAGMGPWESGKVAAEVANPSSNISDSWAKADAESRLQSFGLIVKMEQDGDMAYIFTGPNAASGFGALPALIVWAIVVTVVGLAAVVVTYLFLAKRLEVNNAIMRDLCQKAQAEGDQATVEKCIQATRDIQAIDPFSAAVSELGKVALILGGGYLAFRYGIPWAIGALAKAARPSSTQSLVRRA
jgi:hypothetical protein